MAAKIGSILLASPDPAGLQDWYARAFELTDLNEVGDYKALGFDGFWVMFDQRSDVAERNADPARYIINVDVDDARAVVARLDEQDTDWVAPLEDRDGSLFACAIDPDGNYVQVIELSDAARAEMATATTT